MTIFPAMSSETSSSSSSYTGEVKSRRSRYLARLAGTRVDVYLRDNVTITGILSVRGNCPIYPIDWGRHPLLPEEIQTAVRYTRGLPAPEDGWRTVVGKRTRKKEEGKFDKFGKLPHDNPMLWLRNAQKRAGGMTVTTSVMHPLVAISWRDIQGIAGTFVEEVSGPKKARFQIDNQISANQGGGRSGEKVLEKWTDDHSDELSDWPSLEAAEDDKLHGWNQFEENSRMFGVKTTYDEGLYTTQLNVGEIPEDVQRRAAEIAGEINGGRYKDEDDDEEDEEKKFSAVAGTGSYAPRKKIVIPPPPPTTKPPPAPHVSSLKKLREESQANVSAHHKKEILLKSSQKRLPKDNINALNLEPIKPTKKISGARPGWKADKIPNRQETLEEFSQSAQAIQEKMEKKGWTSPSVAGSAPAISAKQENVSGNPLNTAMSRESSQQGTSTATRFAPAPTPSTAANNAPNVSTQIKPNASNQTASQLGASSFLTTSTGAASTAPSSSTTNIAPMNTAGPPASTTTSTTTTQGRREDSFRFNPNANSFTPKGEPCEKPSNRPIDNYIYQTLNEITQALVHSNSNPYHLTSWSPRFQVSYIDCLAASPAAYAPYPYTEYPPPPPMVMIKDTPAAGGYYYAPY